ncbi:hypothetical protein G6F67_009731 [Rhizopus microsporus]|nr:hypothetical protein G6F67_009731 [Rhizopus microsporus]
MGRTDLIQHKIIIDKDAMPISHRPYRLSPIEAEYLKKELEKYCKLGIISPSNSPWAAPTTGSLTQLPRKTPIHYPE